MPFAKLNARQSGNSQNKVPTNLTCFAVEVGGGGTLIYFPSVHGWSYYVKDAQSYLFNFFQTFWRVCYHKKAHSFFITHDKFYS